jgi:hypothetical protein
MRMFKKGQFKILMYSTVICEDINLPFSQTKWMIIEVNHNPDLTIHEIPNL